MFMYLNPYVRKRLVAHGKLVWINAEGELVVVNAQVTPGELAINLLGPMPLPENVPPIVTSAVLLDAKAHMGNGEALKPGTLVTKADIEAMLAAQGLGWRGILPGDVVYIYTGWGDNWDDPDTKKTYYTMGPGISIDASEYLAERKIVLGKKSGLDSIRLKSDELGLGIPKEKYPEILAEVKSQAVAAKRLLSDDEFKVIVEAAL